MNYRQGAFRSVFVAFLWAILLVPGLLLSGSLLSPSAEAAQVSDYQLGSGDQILIRVYGEEDLTIETLLSDSGLINYPFLGELKVTGLTLGKLEALIIAGLKGDYLISPNVQVSIIEYRPFFINGEVEKPGGYPFQPGLSIAKAAALAEGFTERASASKIFIIRGDDASQMPIKVGLNTLLRPGDIVTIEQSFF